MSPREAGLVFGELAEEFDRVRPTYPEALIDAACAGLAPGARALEVGAGTGKATAAVAARGLSIVAIEPDPAMAAILTRTVPGVDVVVATFEDHEPAGRYDLLFSADAWHWTRPDTRWEQAARALAPGGVLALFWNLARLADEAQRQSMLDTFAAVAPSLEVRDEPVPPGDALTRWPGPELVPRPEFADPRALVFPWTWTISRADFVTHVSTRSQLRMLDPAPRERLLAALTATLADEITMTMESVLYLARRRPSSARYVSTVDRL